MAKKQSLDECKGETIAMNRPSTRHMVAPELAAALDAFPKIDFANGIAAFRGDLLGHLMPPLPPELEAVTRHELRIPGPGGAPEVRMLHYVPPGLGEGRGAALMNIHGGGYVLGQPEQNDAANRMRALELGCQVFAPAYRLAPETVFPGAVEDCHAALGWIAANAEKLNIDPGRIAVSGESAGGGHAAALALHARNALRRTGSGPVPCFLLLDSPMLDDRTGSNGDPHPWCGEFVWPPEHNRFGWRSMLGMEPGGDDVPAEAVPARVADLSDLPPTFIAVGAIDLFLEEDIEFARRLSRAGVPVELHVIPGAYHGFSMARGTPLVETLKGLELQALRRAFASAEE